jgi:hypothetical protein
VGVRSFCSELECLINNGYRTYRALRRFVRTNNYSNFADSTLACFRMGMSGSASFECVRQS